MLNLIVALFVYGLGFFAQPFAAVDAFVQMQAPQFIATKSCYKMEAEQPSPQIEVENPVLREGGDPPRLPGKTWHPVHGFLGASAARAFHFKAASAGRSGGDHPPLPFRPSPLQSYEILLI